MPNIAITEKPAARSDKSIFPKDIQGLCQTCCHAPDCGFLARATANVVFCEEFQNHGHSSVQAIKTQRVHGENPPNEMPITESADLMLKTLCVNCMKKNECVYLKPGRSVWYCEEYQ